jgi:hypothetical protein
VQAVGSRARIEEAFVSVIPADPVMLDASALSHFEYLCLLRQVAEVRAIDHDLVSKFCLHRRCSSFGRLVVRSVPITGIR